MNLFDINNIVTTVFGYPLSYIEFIGTLSGLISVWLAARNNILTWPTGLINVSCFFAVFFQVQLYADAFLQVFFFIASIYGWITWKMNIDEIQPKSFILLSVKNRLKLLLGIIFATVVSELFVKNIHLIFPEAFTLPAAYPVLDSFVAIMSIAATILLAKRVLENWVLWITVDIISIFLYASKNVLFISAEYVIFLVLAVFGLYSWLKKYNEKRVDFR
ncbi:MAG: nicotinamide riboside transporter PnuC [Sphingobacteriales bacterium]|nr:MAG: nicotinamide riboside transporter PnuC [Sphingobacteriales bacterium]